ncbi:MAG: sigma-70 family RNA polymerase sigma factor [Planctomycetes bacterium]|nr:sigma-70 family RNA polymerase sigma factor [Planctomycetota bacterium]
MNSNIDQTVTSLLAAGAQRGEPAWDALCSRLVEPLRVWVDVHLHGGMRGRIDPADVMQETWARAMGDVHRFDSSKGKFRAWLFGIARNVLRDAFRACAAPDAGRGGTAWAASLDQVSDSVRHYVRDVDRNDALNHLAETIRTLDEGDQTLAICALEGIKLSDAALRLGINYEATVKRWQKLRARLATGPVARDLLELAE